MVLPIISSLPLPHLHLPSARDPHSRRRARADPVDMDVDSSSSNASSDNDDDNERDLGIGSSKTMITTPGEPISTAKEFMRGHGTYLSTVRGGGAPNAYEEIGEDGEEVGGADGADEGETWVMGSVAGVVERVNKLVSVKSTKGRYIPAIGDLLIGRITDVRQSTWKVDCSARVEGSLGLGSVNLPGGVLRRKLESDVLRMRELLKEGDLLVAEVQGLKGDGGMELHTRSLRYGKLRNGLLLTLSPHLIRRLKSHFITLPAFTHANASSGPSSKGRTQTSPAVDIILGVNGYVWVMGSTGEGEEERRVMGFQGGASVGKDGEEGEGLDMYSDENDIITPSTRRSITLASQLILLFAKYSIPLTDVLLIEGQRWCVALGWGGEGAGMSEEKERRIVAGVCGVGEGEVELV